MIQFINVFGRTLIFVLNGRRIEENRIGQEI